MSTTSRMVLCGIFLQPAFCLAVPSDSAVASADRCIRVATFNASLNRPSKGQLRTDLSENDQQAAKVARIIRTACPDILLLNEFDYDASGESVKRFQQQFLANTLDGGPAPISYPYSFVAEVNTGVPSGVDVDQDGTTDGMADGFGFGAFPGQYGMVVLSKYQILHEDIRTFRKLLWSQLPGAAKPVSSKTNKAWYPRQTWAKLRLSSKSHWDIPIRVQGRTIHLLASHPTPPAFDGAEDRNGKRNHDEIRLWAEYVSNKNCDWLVDDAGKSGGLDLESAFVIVGDLNADPRDGGSHDNAINQLLLHPRIDAEVAPSSLGAVEAAKVQGRANLKQLGNPKFDTADFSDRVVGNLRVDYVLPSVNLQVVQSQVVWPRKGEPLFDEAKCSDHHMVWLDVIFK